MQVALISLYVSNCSNEVPGGSSTASGEEVKHFQQQSGIGASQHLQIFLRSSYGRLLNPVFLCCWSLSDAPGASSDRVRCLRVDAIRFAARDERAVDLLPGFEVEEFIIPAIKGI